MSSNRNERVCQMIGGQYVSCTSSCLPNEICPSVCSPSKCEIFSKTKISEIFVNQIRIV